MRIRLELLKQAIENAKKRKEEAEQINEEMKSAGIPISTTDIKRIKTELSEDS